MQFLILVAHRLSSTTWPPNTLEAFLRLVELDIKAVEFDVTERNDGGLIVAHPGLTSPNGLANCPPLASFLRVGRKYSVEMFADIKPRGPKSARLISNVLRAINSESVLDLSIILSRHEALLRIARLSGIRTGHIIDIGKPKCTRCTYLLVSVNDKREIPRSQIPRSILVGVTAPDQIYESENLGIPYVMSDHASTLKRMSPR